MKTRVGLFAAGLIGMLTLLVQFDVAFKTKNSRIPASQSNYSACTDCGTPAKCDDSVGSKSKLSNRACSQQ